MDIIDIDILKPIFDQLAMRVAMILFIPLLITLLGVAILNRCNAPKVVILYGMVSVFLFSVYKMFGLFYM
ncbi:TPA: hypothetical protein QC291_005358 [Bacillus cereus]|uniref:Uncharacterized protein n=1 Tax=Bacillus pacificus TaxID=2026187 RepID=A0A1Y5ZE54_9BACI|nr:MULTISPECIES: hypothetical protein [Bacteria]KMQ12511.1 hypothetical protein TU69_25070 [Bacillus cereus]MBM6769257.1 hypothetical protein [Bacillus cereus]MCU5365114.1 hypothetical protein [Bacillus paranthracis]MCZ7519728.1 hypothetical protein [Bacillus pacificus]MDA1507890.1 hypothetical protein [Bacillus cereus group sp. TH36-2LC]